MPHTTSEVRTFPMTRQGVRNLDAVKGRVLPVSGGPAPRQPSQKNVGEVERIASAAAGGILALAGLSRGTLPGLAVALVGGGLVYRGLSGHCDLYAALGLNTSGQSAAESHEEIAYRVR